MIEYRTPLGHEALAAAGLGAIVTEAPGYPSPVSEARKPAAGFASADFAAAVAGAQVRVSGNFRFGTKHQDLLTIGSAESGTFTSSGGEAIAFAYDRTTGVLTLSGTASAGAYDEAFEAVRFAIAGDDPDDGGAAASRTIAYSIFDGAAYSDVAEASVAVVAVNDAPTAAILGEQSARLGGETSVTNPSAGSDSSVAMAALEDGGYVVTWTHSANMGGEPSTIRGQRFDAAGVATGAEFQISATGTYDHSSIAAFDGGGFVVSWESGDAIRAQRYSASGVKVGGQIVIATANNQEMQPTVATLADGGFVIAWHYAYRDGSGEAVLAQRFNAAGVAQGGAVQVNTFTANDQHLATAAGLEGGGHVIIWQSWQQDGPGAGIFGQRFDSAGVAQGGEFRVNTSIANNQQNPSVASLAGGGFVVTWDSTQAGIHGPAQIYAQRYDSAGNPLGSEFRVTAVGGVESSVSSLADGGFVISWNGGGDVYARRYDAAGTAVAAEALVNTYANGTQWHGAVAGLAGGDFAVAWATYNSGQGYTGVFQQRFTDGFQIDEGSSLALNGRIGIDDVDSGTDPITVTLSVDHGALAYVPLTDNAATVTGHGTSTLQITGTVEQVKAFLGDDTILLYSPVGDAPATHDTLNVRIEDAGGNGGGPLAADTRTIIGITPVNDKPVLSAPTSAALSFTEGDGPVALMQGVAVSDPDLPANFANGWAYLSVSGTTGGLELRSGSAFQVALSPSGFSTLTYQGGGEALTLGTLGGLGTRAISIDGLNAAATPGLISDLLDDFVFVDGSDNPAAGNRTVTLSVFDGGNIGIGSQTTAVTTQTIAVTPVNDAPTVDWAHGSGYEDMTRAQVLLVGLDADSTSLSYTLASLPENGILYSAATGGVALSVGSTIPVNAQGRGVAYFQPDLNWNGDTIFTFNVSDGSLSSPAQTATIAIRATNDAPLFSGVATLNAVEQTQVVLAAGITVSDLELDPRNGGAGDYSGSTLTVGGSIPSTPGDTFALVAGPSFTIAGNDLEAGGLTFGTITGNANGKLTIAFTGAEAIPTRALVNEVIQAVRYTNTSDAAPASYIVALVLNDGGTDQGQGYPGAASGSRAISVNMTRVNDGPSSTLLGGDVATWTEGDSARLLDPTGNATIADVDSANFDGGSLTVAIDAGGISAQDRLVLTAVGGVTFTTTTVSVGGTQIATYTGGGAAPLVFRFDADATPAAVQSLVRAVAYTNSGGDTPTAGARTIDWTLVDGDGTANSGVDRLNLASSVNVVAVNDVPTSTGSTAKRVFTEGVNGAADHIVVNDTVVLNDVDNFTFGLVQVIIINNYVQGEDIFTFVNNNPTLFGDITGSFDASIGYFSLRSPSGTATQAQFQAAVRTVAYDNLSEEPTPGDRSIQVRALDNHSVSAAVGFTLQVVARNDSPSGANRTIAINEDEVRTLAVADFGFSDVDGDGFRAVRFGSAPTGGTLYWDADGAFGAAPAAITGFPTGEYLAADIALGKLTFGPEANRNGAGIGTIVFTVLDDGGTNAGGQNSAATANVLTVDVAAVDDVAGTADDSAATSETAPVDIDVLANDGNDLDGPWQPGAAPKPLITHIAGQAVSLGQKVILSSGATVTLNDGGILSYDPNGQFARLTDSTSGAANTLAADSFAYSVAGGGTATVGVTVHGVAGPGDELRGDGGSDRITGTEGGDRLFLQDGGDDIALAGGGDDNIFFIGSLTAADVVNGGAGVDTLVLQGPYGALALSADVTQIENVSILGGGNTAFGDPGTNFYDYVLTTNDANFAAGVQARVNGAALLAGEDFTFDGSAETDAKFVVYGGRGRDTLLGGLGNDIFFFAEERFASGDTVNGGAGYNGMFLRGNYTIDFNAPGYTGLFTNIHNLTLTSATDERYARGGGSEFDYNLTLSNAIVNAGETLTISGTILMASETMILDASQESDGFLRLFGGKANDTLKGGGRADLLHGNLGADILTGNGGADVFRFQETAESNSATMDQILDFTPGTDKIELDRIDANTLVGGDQAFSWIGSNAFSGSAGQLRAYEQGGTWFVEGDTNGDSVADLVIALTLQGPTPLSSGDFLL